MSGIIPGSPRYRLGSLLKHPNSSTSTIVDRHSQLERRQLPPAPPHAQAQQQLVQEEVQHNSQEIFLCVPSIALATNLYSLDPQP
jgi:hypothetical protein